MSRGQRLSKKIQELLVGTICFYYYKHAMGTKIEEKKESRIACEVQNEYEHGAEIRPLCFYYYYKHGIRTEFEGGNPRIACGVQNEYYYEAETRNYASISTKYMPWGHELNNKIQELLVGLWDLGY